MAAEYRLATGRVLVTGAAGMLGSQLLLDAPQGVEAIGTDLTPGGPGHPAVVAAGFDLTLEEGVRRLFAEHGPFDGVIHAAAYTAVDRAETDLDLARRVNAHAPALLARAAATAKIPMVVVSTDFVFDGTARRPYLESDPVAPLGVYGLTKWEGEEAARAAHPAGAMVVRTQWLYGPRGAHFPGTMLRLASERPELTVVADQVGSPTSTLELAPALWDTLRQGVPGVYHGACEGRASWYDFAVATLEMAGVRGIAVRPCTTAEFPRPAQRPAFSVLDCNKLATLRGRRLAPWRNALANFLERHGPNALAAGH